MSRTSMGAESARNSYTLHVNDPKLNVDKGFPTNHIRTTKYTLLTFFPKNLFEQFRRVSNFYFLTVVIIQLIPQITPLIPITSILPLAFVLAVTALKEAIEDFARYKADKKNNTELYKVVRDGRLQTVFSQDIGVGEIVYVANGQHFPADLILISSSSDDGICYVETANLDGETNLKVRKGLEATLIYQDVEDLAQFKGVIQCETPNERLYRFNGRLIMEGKDKTVYSLNHTMFLQRGAQLRNSKYCYGVCVYAGVDTKLFLNQQPPPSKFSTVERTLNRFILFVFLVQILVCLACAIASGFFEDSEGSKMPYLGHNPYAVPVYGLRNFFTYFVLFNTMIPISLWVTLELMRVGQAKFMEWDGEMASITDGIEGSGCKAKTSNLNEDLGRIQHIFSDKTGTLTENSMNFCKCSVRMDSFDEKNKPAGLIATLEYPTTPDDTVTAIGDFLRILAVCHTVVSEVDSETGEITYQSQSPDETALVDTARNNGYVFVKRKAEEIIIRERGIDVSYALLAVLEFSSVRRRMSVIVRTPQGQIKLLSKGADLVMFDRMADGDKGVKDETLRNLREFSREGYRTLVLAQRDISVEEFSEWKMAFYQANNSIENREEKVENVCELIETELTLVGCTAIEDKLQDEVPETIHYLLEAGIQLWVLTGDKQETAINIGYSSRLLNPSMDLLIVNAENSEICGEILRAALDKIDDNLQQSELGMVIDGHSLGFALHDHTEEFLRLGRCCRSVICCRVTPLQKALVVRVVKQGEQKVSLAIGDGANDVSMIQEAHVGVGIFGKEGTQAARASDYAIHQFRFLRRLLCIHGRYSYIRVAGIIQYSFYKNMCFTLGLLWFSFVNGFSGQTLYDPWIITLYNIVFTSLPPFLFGLFEKDLNEEVITQHAEVYRRMQVGKLFTRNTFFVWILSGIWHSLVIYYGSTFLFNNNILFSSGKTLELWEFGSLASTLAIFVVNLRIALEIKTWNWLSLGGIVLSLAVYLLFVVVYNATTLFSVAMADIYFHLLGMINFYLMLAMLSVLSLIPDFAIKYISRQYFPEDWQILREKYRSHDLVELQLENFRQQSSHSHSRTPISNGASISVQHQP